MRPTFDIPVGDEGHLVLARLREQLDAPGAEFSGQVRSNHAFVRLPEDRSSLLSPHLNLELLDAEEGTVLHGRFSPHPNVWTGFMAVFFTLGMLGLTGFIYGVSQYMLDGPVWAMWALPASLALIAFIYGAAFIGQGLSSEEMFALRAFVECTVREVCTGSR
jgi:hypothetical protein